MSNEAAKEFAEKVAAGLENASVTETPFDGFSVSSNSTSVLKVEFCRRMGVVEVTILGTHSFSQRSLPRRTLKGPTVEKVIAVAKKRLDDVKALKDAETARNERRNNANNRYKALREKFPAYTHALMQTEFGVKIRIDTTNYDRIDAFLQRLKDAGIEIPSY